MLYPYLFSGYSNAIFDPGGKKLNKVFKSSSGKKLMR
jgi:hypothetical protein